MTALNQVVEDKTINSENCTSNVTSSNKNDGSYENESENKIQKTTLSSDLNNTGNNNLTSNKKIENTKAGGNNNDLSGRNSVLVEDSRELLSSSLSISIRLPVSANLETSQHNLICDDSNYKDFEVIFKKLESQTELKLDQKLVDKNYLKNNKTECKKGSPDLNFTSDDLFENKVILEKFLKAHHKNNHQIIELNDDESDNLLIIDDRIFKNQIFPANKKYLNISKFKMTTSSSSLATYFNGMPSSNGFVMNKVNPSRNSDFSYLNRNKLVNRRLTLKKQFENSVGLKSMIESDPVKNLAASQFKVNDTKQLGFYNHLNDKSETNSNSTTKKDLSKKGLASSLNDDEFISNFHNNRRSNKVTYSTDSYYKKKSRQLNDRESSKLSNSVSPSPCSYHVPRRPLNEKAAPIFTIGQRNFIEKDGGGRTSWQKEYFANKNPFIIKTDYNREQVWPSPNNYKLKSLIGDPVSIAHHKAPMISIGTRLKTINESSTTESYELNKNDDTQQLIDSKAELAMAQSKFDYEANVAKSAKFVKSNAPKITIKFRDNGTKLWNKIDDTPGPGSYNHEKFKNVAKSGPQYSLPHAKLNLF